MNTSTRNEHTAPRWRSATAWASLAVLIGVAWTAAAAREVGPGTPVASYVTMSAIAPAGVSADRYLDIPTEHGGPTAPEVSR